MTLPLLLQMAADGYGARSAMGSGDSTVSYARLAAAAHAGAALIHREHARSVAFVGVNGTSFATSLFAAAVARRAFLPLNYRLPDDRIRRLIARLEFPMLVADDGLVRRLGGAAASVMPTGDWAASVSRAAGEPGWCAPLVSADDIAIVLFTSGTTGEPKAVPLRHGNLASYILTTVEFGSASVGDAALMSVPSYHVAGVASTLSNVYAGRRIVHLPNFSADQWLELVRAEEVTSAMVVPTMLARIVDVAQPDDPRLRTLRSIAYGGAPVSSGVLLRALELMPAVEFTNAYGLTETSSTITILSPGDHSAALREPNLRDRLRSAGRAVPGVELEVRDAEGSPCEPDEPGELWVRGVQVSGEYAGRGSVLDANGWFPTRDRATLDVDGYLYLHGRSDDTIIRGGENISPTEIETVIRELAGVADVCVVGLPDEEWGEHTVAVVQARADSPLTAGQVRHFARARLRRSLTPDHVVVSTRQLPYSPLGKLLRREVADLAAEALRARS